MLKRMVTIDNAGRDVWDRLKQLKNQFFYLDITIWRAAVLSCSVSRAVVVLAFVILIKLEFVILIKLEFHHLMWQLPKPWRGHPSSAGVTAKLLRQAKLRGRATVGHVQNDSFIDFGFKRKTDFIFIQAKLMSNIDTQN